MEVTKVPRRMGGAPACCIEKSTSESALGSLPAPKPVQATDEGCIESLDVSARALSSALSFFFGALSVLFGLATAH